jgi:hypothetical protein
MAGRAVDLRGWRLADDRAVFAEASVDDLS